MILATEEVIKVVSTTTNVILVTEKLITPALTVISATTKMVTEEVTTATLKVIADNRKVNLATE